MPKTVLFLRHGKLDLPYRDHAEMPFDVFADLGSGKLNPPIDTAFAGAAIHSFRAEAMCLPGTRIISSPSRRCLETASYFSSVLGDVPSTRILTSSALAEVEFDLRILNAENRIAAALSAHDITAANAAVFHGMLSGQGCELVSDVYSRVEEAFKLIRAEESPVVCFTHDFFMRVIEIYIHRRGVPYFEVTMDDLLRTKRNTYLNGFQTDLELNTFSAFPLEKNKLSPQQ